MRTFLPIGSMPRSERAPRPAPWPSTTTCAVALNPSSEKEPAQFQLGEVDGGKILGRAEDRDCLVRCAPVVDRVRTGCLPIAPSQTSIKATDGDSRPDGLRVLARQVRPLDQLPGTSCPAARLRPLNLLRR